MNLLENKQQYTQMLQPLVTVGVVTQQEMETVVREIRPRLRKNGRIVWWIKWYRLAKLWESRSKYFQSSFQQTSVNELYDKVLRTFNLTDVEEQANIFINRFSIGTEIFDHNMSFLAEIPKFDNLVWEGTPADLLRKIDAIASEWEESRREEIDMQDYEGPHWEKLIDYGDKAWVLLDAAVCRLEGGAMGHCGNTAAPTAGDRILSFRTIYNDRPTQKPHLTFILHEDGTLGEMKGRGNTKPKGTYHKVIIDLLLNDIVTGIVGGGYMSEANFSLGDLSDSDLAIIINNKPAVVDVATALGRLDLPFNELSKSQRDDLIFHIYNNDLGGARDKMVINDDNTVTVEFFDGIDAIGEDFASHFKLSTLTWLCEKVEYGDIYIDYAPDSAELAELLSLTTPQNNRIINKIINDHVDEDIAIEDYDGMIDIITSNRHNTALGEIDNALTTAHADGVSAGTYDLMFTDMEDALTANNVIFNKTTSLWEFKLGRDQIVPLITPYYGVFVDDYDDIGEMLELVDADAGRYGWYAYSESVAVDRFDDAIYEESAAFKEILDKEHEEVARMKDLAGIKGV